MTDPKDRSPSADPDAGSVSSPRRAASQRRAVQRLTAEEVASVFRHDLTGKIGAARMFVHTLKRRTIGEGAPVASDARVVEAIAMLEGAMTGALEVIERPLYEEGEDDHDPIDVSELVTEIAKDVIDAGKLAVDAPSPVWLDAGEDDVSVAILALIENAIAPAGKARVRCSRDGDRGRVEVIDAGPGLPEGFDEAALFPPTKPGHLGIGLRIVRRVARRWDGRFSITRDGANTVAILELPAIAVDESEPNDG